MKYCKYNVFRPLTSTQLIPTHHRQQRLDRQFVVGARQLAQDSLKERRVAISGRQLAPAEGGGVCLGFDYLWKILKKNLNLFS